MTTNIKYYGIDGEGYYDTDHNTHIYDMLTIGDVTIGEPGRQLSYGKIFRSVLDHKRNVESEGITPIYQLFFGTYDFTQWIRSMPKSSLEFIAGSRSMNNPKAVSIGRSYKMLYQPNKWLKIWDQNNDDYVKVNDAGPNFGTSFINACNAVLTVNEYPQHERDIIEEGKSSREKSYTAFDRKEDWDDVKQYNRLECKILGKICERFAPELSKIIGEDVTCISGPGTIAALWLRNQDIARGDELMNAWGRDNYLWFNDAYFGGMFETLQFGIIREPVYQYDINSAYPAAMIDLPDLTDSTVEVIPFKSEDKHHENWEEKVDEYMNSLVDMHNGGKIVFVEGTIKGSTDVLGPAPMRRKDQGVVRAKTGATRLTMREYLASLEGGLIEQFWPESARVITLANDNKPFAPIADMYDARLNVGKNTVAGMAYKTVYNSIYGKLSQSRGVFAQSNPVYAALITAECRSKIIEAITAMDDWESNVVAIATDAFITRDRNTELPLTSSLGDWEESVFEQGMWVVQNGIYGNFGNDEALLKVKTRGITLNSLTPKIHSHIIPKLQEFEQKGNWDRDTTITLDPGFTITTLAEASRMDDVTQVGSIQPLDRILSFDTTKRVINAMDDDYVFHSASYNPTVIMDIEPRANVIGVYVAPQYITSTE